MSDQTPLSLVHDAIAQTCHRAGRQASDVCLIAVSKTKPAEAVLSLIAQGHRHFGENKVQEAQGKFPAIKEEFPDTFLHLIGPLQSNKVKDAMAIADAIHSVDRPKLVDAIARERDRLGRCPQLFVQVNIGEEPQKAGVTPRELPGLITLMQDRALPINGLMCIPPANDPPAGHFAFLKMLSQRHELHGLSMGMSADYPAAVELGATHIRVGSALFGARG